VLHIAILAIFVTAIRSIYWAKNEYFSLGYMHIIIILPGKWFLLHMRFLALMKRKTNWNREAYRQ
jgi:hypothetical protein